MSDARQEHRRGGWIVIGFLIVFVGVLYVAAVIRQSRSAGLNTPTTQSLPVLNTAARSKDLLAFIQDGGCINLPEAWCPRLQQVGFEPGASGYTIYAQTTLTAETRDAKAATNLCDALYQYATNWDQHKDIHIVQVRNSQGGNIAAGVVGIKRC